MLRSRRQSIVSRFIPFVRGKEADWTHYEMKTIFLIPLDFQVHFTFTSATAQVVVRGQTP